MKKVKQLTIMSILCGVFLTLNSCIRDDSSCSALDDNVRLLVKLDIDVAITRFTNPYGIDNVHLYIFDEEDNMIQTHSEEIHTDDASYEFSLNLSPGEYQFVIWTNLGDSYQVSHTLPEAQQENLKLADLYVYLNRGDEGGDVTTDIPNLYHGLLRGAKIEANKNHEFVIPITPNTYRLNFVTEGLPVTTDNYTFTVGDNNSHYNFENTLLANTDPFNYIRTAQFNANNELATSMKVLRLAANRTPSFTFGNQTTGTTIYANNLIEMIVKAYQTNEQILDFEETFEFTIKLSFDVNLNATVWVNDWMIISQPSELG
ncbi:FimB/Mfa2 family fimbrial subunit [Bacteroides sp. 519]|uniref:FimB/Mfa2 family fimbrial subunit n=1 Tax=Bacteroides sp. 519 TaxID=2302937 RepID=UPI0013D098A4|nr:FimB/Mfa2 family fimbrial subunit [Bacteroides sp. 519]NDV56921.1 hypothetical protein [Bacteroides sp. 519]